MGHMAELPREAVLVLSLTDLIVEKPVNNLFWTNYLKLNEPKSNCFLKSGCNIRIKPCIEAQRLLLALLAL